jgi:hypothetical protein
MTASKKTAKAVPARLQDLKPKKNPKAGALNAYIKTEGLKKIGTG